MTKNINIHVSDNAYDAIKNLAEKEQRSIASMTRIIIEEGLAKRKEKSKCVP
jgi:hypothetical protein